MKNRNAEWLAHAVLVVTLAVAGWSWGWMWPVPPQTPIHWNIIGQLNGHWSKLLGLYLIPMIALTGYTFMGAVSDTRPEEFEGRVMSALSWVKLAYVLLMAGVFGVIAADARVANLIINYAIIPLFVLMAIAMGNLMVRSVQLEKERTSRPGGGIRI
jgi:hypothetical protein